MKLSIWRVSWLMVVSSILLLAFIFFLLPNLSLAQSNSVRIVPCDGLDCTTCHFLTLANNGIIWLFGIIFIIFAVLMAIAGFGLVTSGGSQSALSAAKSKFQNALIGILIVMSAWLLVDTIMVSLLKNKDLSIFNSSTYSGWGPWAQIECIAPIVPFEDHNDTPSTGQDGGGIVQGSCSVSALSVISDTEAMKMEQGNPVIFNNPSLQACATKFITSVGGGAKVNSAYRPQAYQNHLWEIKNRWCDVDGRLKTNNQPECSALKEAVHREILKHFGSSWDCGAVAPANSRHASGIGVDIGGINNHGDSAIQAKAQAACLVWKNYGGDPWHYDLKNGCSCSP